MLHHSLMLCEMPFVELVSEAFVSTCQYYWLKMRSGDIVMRERKNIKVHLRHIIPSIISRRLFVRQLSVYFVNWHVYFVASFSDMARKWLWICMDGRCMLLCPRPFMEDDSLCVVCWEQSTCGQILREMLPTCFIFKPGSHVNCIEEKAAFLVQNPFSHIWEAQRFLLSELPLSGHRAMRGLCDTLHVWKSRFKPWVPLPRCAPIAKFFQFFKRLLYVGPWSILYLCIHTWKSFIQRHCFLPLHSLPGLTQSDAHV